MNNNIAPRKRYDELNYFNAIACLFVILIHVLSLGINTIDRTTTQMALVYLPWKFAAYVVPGFLFTGAVKMALGFESTKKVGYIKYILRRAQKIYLPYVITVCVYFAYFWYIGWYVADPKLLLESIIYGNISSPFYYVVTVMQFYLLMPLWKWMVKRVTWFTAIPVSALITFAVYRLANVLSVYGIEFIYGDRIFPAYLFFWVCGLYVGKYYDKVVGAVRAHKLSILLCAIPSLAFAYMNYWQYSTNNWVYLADANCMKLLSDTLSIMFFLCVCVIISDSSVKWLKKLLGGIFAASFSVYLTHCLFLNLADRYVIAQYGISDIGAQLLIRAAVCFTLPFVWYFLAELVKKSVKKLFKRKDK